MRTRPAPVSIMLAAIVVALAAVAAAADEEASSSWLDAYRWNAEASAGYRLVDIDGSKAKYREDYDLRSGGRLLGLSVSGRARDPEAGHVDRFSLEIETPHDEPYSSVRARLADDRLYDLRVSFDQSTYDYAVPQLFQGPVAGVLTVHPADWATVLAGYHVYGHTGDTITTRFVPGADTFLLGEDVDSLTHEGFVGTQLRLLETDVDLRQEFRRTDRTYGLGGPLPGAAGGLDPTNGGTLATLTGAQDERIDQPTTRLRVHRAFGDRLELTGGYVYSHADLTFDANRFRQGTVANPVFPSRELRTATGDASLDAHVLDLESTARVTERVRVTTAYRYDTRDQSGNVVRRDAFGRVAADAGYRIEGHRIDGTVEADLRDDLTVRVGARVAHRDARIGARDVGTDGIGALADLRYRPWSFLGLDLRYESLHVDDPFVTRGGDRGGVPVPERETSLTFVNRGSAGIHVTPIPWASLRYRFLADSRENASFGGRVAAFGHEASIDLTPRDDLSALVSWSHRDVNRSGDIRIAPLYGAVTALERGSEDVLVAQLSYAFELFAQRWSVGSSVSVAAADQLLRPAFERGRARTAFELRRVDGSAWLRLHHRWVEPGIEFRMIDYTEDTLPANDYRATMALFTLTRRWSR
jgi:hypothetical protein